MSKIIEEGENIGKHYEKQDKFINLILLHPNQSKYRSAMLAGYAVKSLEKRVPALMRDKKFLARLEEKKRVQTVWRQSCQNSVASPFGARVNEN